MKALELKLSYKAERDYLPATFDCYACGLSVSFDSIVWLTIWPGKKSACISCPSNAEQYLCVCPRWSNIVNAKHGHFSCSQTQLTAIWPISCDRRAPQTCKLWRQRLLKRKYIFAYARLKIWVRLSFHLWQLTEFWISLSVYKRPFYEYMENYHLAINFNIWVGGLNNN